MLKKWLSQYHSIGHSKYMGISCMKGYLHLWAGDLDIEYVSDSTWASVQYRRGNPNIVIIWRGKVRYQWRW